jgi:hypothetical protein
MTFGGEIFKNYEYGRKIFGHGDITGDQSVDFWTQDRKITTKFVEPQTRNWMS